MDGRFVAVECTITNDGNLAAAVVVFVVVDLLWMRMRMMCSRLTERWNSSTARTPTPKMMMMMMQMIHDRHARGVTGPYQARESARNNAVAVAS